MTTTFYIPDLTVKEFEALVMGYDPIKENVKGVKEIKNNFYEVSHEGTVFNGLGSHREFLKFVSDNKKQ